MRYTIKRLLLRPGKAVASRAYYASLDGLDLLLGRREPLTPPRRMNFVGGADFKETGEEFLEHFVNLGRLTPDDRVLDVGCGIGRMAVPLTRYLNVQGSYEGFDIVPKGIEWCTKNITPRYPNFRFCLADVHNQEYNPKGKHTAATYRFPYETDEFDFAFLTSVFTHMLPDELDNYLSEISRVLRPRGKALISFYLLNQESLTLTKRGAGTLRFPHERGSYRVFDDLRPELAVAYDEIFVRNLCESYDLEPVEPICYGSWCGRERYLSFQDVVVVVR